MKLNVMIRNDENIAEKLISLKYNKKAYNNLYEMSEYLKSKYNIKCMYYECEYDIECKKKYIYSLARKSKKLDLDVDFNELEFDRYYNVTKDHVLVINSILVGGGIGGIEEVMKILEAIMFIWDFFKSIMSFLKVLLVYFFPFYNIKIQYGYGKNFLQDIIMKSETWDYGFLQLKKIKFNKLLERAIMHKFGYQLKNKKWINEIYVDSYRNLNKYDSF